MILGELNGIVYKDIEVKDYQDVLELFMEVLEGEF